MPTYSCSNSGRFFYDDIQWVELRVPLYPEDIAYLESKSKNTVIYCLADEDGNYCANETIETDQDLADDEYVEYLIHDWYLLDNSKREIPCTYDNKLLLVRGDIKFAEWVHDRSKILSEMCGKRAEVAEKNLEDYIDRLRKDLDCKTCRKTHMAFGPSPEEKGLCKGCWPEIMPENKDPIRLWGKVAGQRIVAGMGGTVGIRQDAVWRWIDELEIKNRIECFYKVNKLAHYTFECEREEYEQNHPKR